MVGTYIAIRKNECKNDAWPVPGLDCCHFFAFLILPSVHCMSKVVTIRPLAKIILLGCVSEIQKCYLVNDAIIDQSVIMTFSKNGINIYYHCTYHLKKLANMLIT